MDLDGFLEKYKYGKCSVLAASRLKTYNNWPYDASIKGCTSVKLAAAGFVSTMDPKGRTGASAACVFCDKDLEFDETDDPWKEHTKRCPDCEFVKMNKQDERTWTTKDYLKLLGAAHILKMKKIVEEELNQLHKAGDYELAAMEKAVEGADSGRSTD